VRRYALAGRPADVAEQISEIAACGVSGIALFPTPLPGQTTESVLREFLERVLPRM
jgi:alkanesulfonate monooxygenase SsuD/methylene tetrahydromethanopterin reductase-like flavin-dependent oxidoreductase (luciferase family)